MPRFAANLTMMFNEHDFLDRFQAAADAGFEAVEYLFPYDHSADCIAERLAAAGLKQALFNMPPGNWAAGERGLAALPGRKKEFQNSVHKAVEYARIIGTPLLHMMAGIADASHDGAMNAYREAVTFAADTAETAGVGLVIEPINCRDMPGYFLNDFNRAVSLIRELDHGNIKLQFDIYHRQIMHGDVLTGLAQMMPLIGHVQIASVPRRNEPGSGELDDFKVFNALDALGYRGYVGCEYRPESDTLSGLSWMKNI